MSKPTLEDLLELIKSGKAREVLIDRLELKASWHDRCGTDLSAIANHESREGGWLVVGVNDDGSVAGRDVNWAAKAEAQITSHIDQFLEPRQTVINIYCRDMGNGFCVFIEVENPGEVATWDGQAYRLIGTSSRKMSSDEALILSLKLPGEDYSRQHWKGAVDGALVLDFAKKSRAAEIQDWPDDLSSLSANDILRTLGISETIAARILFGDIPVRVVHFDQNGDILDQAEFRGAYNILSDSFLAGVQTWTRRQGTIVRGHTSSVTEEMPYPQPVLREVFANAVAHAVYQRNGGALLVEMHPTRLTVINNCLLESKALAKQWFSSHTYVKNKLLMLTLRKPKIADELGTGKNRIFRQMIEAGKREPIIEFREEGKFGRWSVILYNDETNQNLIEFSNRFKELFMEPEQRRIAIALVIWREHSWSDIQERLDSHFKRVAVAVIQSTNSPVIVVDDKIYVKRWAMVLLSGQQSRSFTGAEEAQIKRLLQVLAFTRFDGHISTDVARSVIGLLKTPSETTQLSNLFRKWASEGLMEQIKKGHWKFLNGADLNSKVIMSESGNSESQDE